MVLSVQQGGEGTGFNGGDKNSLNNTSLFYRTLYQMDRETACKKMRQFPQHNGNSTYQHVRNVALYSYFLAEKFDWKIDEVSLARGAILHDYYLYCATREPINGYVHGIRHPRTALENARKLYKLNKKEENIIRSHMWPLTLFHMPTCKEAWLVSIADKLCAVREMFGENKVILPIAHSRWVRELASFQMHRLAVRVSG